MPEFKAKREFLRMEYTIFNAKDRDEAMDIINDEKIRETLSWEPYWNQDEDWQYELEEIKK